MGDGVVRWLRAASSVWSLHGARAEGHLERHAGVTCPLLRLPTEVLLCVMEHLEPYDLCSVAQTCAALERASSADCIWHRFCGDLGADAAGMRWKTKYMQWLAPRLKRFARRRQAELEATSPAERALKVVLYGDRGVGKSTLRRRLTDDRYVPYRPPTTLDIPYWVQTLQVEGLAVTLRLWDCSAQARFRAVTRAFCRDADAVVVVYDITNLDSFGQAQPWVERIRAAVAIRRDPDAEPPSVILVGAKSDLEEHRAVSAAAGQALARELDTLWAETSSLTGSGVREAFQLLAESAVLGELHPSAGGGWHIPDHDLLCRLYNNYNSNTSRPATTGCALQ